MAVFAKEVMGRDVVDLHNEKLGELTKLDKPRWRRVRYYVDNLYKDAVRWAEKVKDVENRTDEEIEYVENFLKGGK